MRTVKLYGELGKKYGKVHRFKVNSPAEAIRALSANFPGFKNYMIEADKFNIGFQVINGKTQLEKEEDSTLPASGEIKIIPRVIGSSATARILIGAVLVVAGIVVTGLSAGAASPIGTFLITAGVSLMLGGVIELLSPKPKIPEPEEAPDNKPSSYFNGPVNTTAQGHPVPVCYGRMIVGGAIVSAGLSVTQLQSGFKRVKVTETKDVSAYYKTSTGIFEEYFSSARPPANYYKTELIATVIGPAGGVASGRTKKTIRYSYYVWTLVPYDS